MSTPNISLPKDLRDFVNDQARALGQAGPGEYVRELIRRDRDRQHLRQLLLEGAASDQAVTADEDCFDRLRETVRQ